MIFKLFSLGGVLESLHILILVFIFIYASVIKNYNKINILSQKCLPNIYNLETTDTSFFFPAMKTLLPTSPD